jgi:hypothetical protein
LLKEIINQKKSIHNRNISLVTYPHNDSEIIVEGTLMDRRGKKIFNILGKVVEPGIVHHMVVRLLVKGNPLMIVHAEAEMHHVPMEDCRSTLVSLEKIIGIEVRSGFSNIIRKTIGGKNGCTHLTHLVTVMGQEIVHGWLTHKRSDSKSVPERIDSFTGSEYILNSCKMWTKEGPRWKSLEKKIHQEQKRETFGGGFCYTRDGK